jgi:ATP-binding cassette, subfamily B, bacterial
MPSSALKSLLGFVCYFLRPYHFFLGLLALCAVLAGVWNALNYYLLKLIIDALSTLSVDSPNFRAVFWLIACIIINHELHNMVWRAMGLINYKIQPLIKNTLISKTFEYASQHSYQFFQNHLAGKLANNIHILADNVEKMVHDLGRYIIRGVTVVLASLVSMYFVNPLFAYGLIIWSIVFVGGSMLASRRIIGLADAYAKAQSELSGRVVDAVSNVQNIRLFSRLEFEKTLLSGILGRLAISFKNKERFLLVFHLLQGFVISLLLALMAYILVHLRAKGLVSVGDFALILGLVIDVGWMLWWTMEQVDMFNEALGKAKQSFYSIFQKQDIQDHPGAGLCLIQKGEICFDRVNFSYPGIPHLFKDLSLTIPSKKKIGLVGYSGSGKSSFVNLILRLYELNSGHIYIDGQDVQSVTQDSLRQGIGMIPQEPVLFHRSILENIRYGKIEASDDEVIEAAKKAHAHEFISHLAEGYHSLVGERGVKLSGGQRQRIAIARAILKNAPILILDEASSQLDSITEGYIQDALWRVMEDKTSIVIAHRLSTLLHMDEILVFDKGEIVQRGTHSGLLIQKGLYQELWNAQVGGFLADRAEE